jgi:hypothetical protein
MGCRRLEPNRQNPQRRNRNSGPAFGLLGIALALCGACNAPHDNPRDPLLGGSLEARVMTRRATGISGATVTVESAGRYEYTDSIGWVGLYGLPPCSSWVSAQASGYAPESVRMCFTRGRTDTFSWYLDGQPYLRKYSVTTHRNYHDYPRNPDNFFQLSTQAGDPDGASDIDSVWAEIPGLDLAYPLEYDQTLHDYTITLNADSLPGGSLEALAGTPVYFYVVDRESVVTQSDPCTVTRIIYDSLYPGFPSGEGQMDSVHGFTTFAWRPFNEGYWVRYRGDIVKDIGFGEELVETDSFFTAGPLDTTFRYDASSLRDTFLWTLEAIDTFGNSCRSKEEVFRVY